MTDAFQLKLVHIEYQDNAFIKKTFENTGVVNVTFIKWITYVQFRDSCLEINLQFLITCSEYCVK